jgi:hypothetical protein
MLVCPQAGWHRCKGRPKNTLFVLPFWFSGKRKRKIFRGWRSEPLAALTATPVTLLLCLGVFAKTKCETPWSFGEVVGVCWWILKMQGLYERHFFYGFYTALAPLEWQTGGSLDFTFTIKNRREKSEIQCADRVYLEWAGVCRLREIFCIMCLYDNRTQDIYSA